MKGFERRWLAGATRVIEQRCWMTHRPGRFFVAKIWMPATPNRAGAVAGEGRVAEGGLAGGKTAMGSVPTAGPAPSRTARQHCPGPPAADGQLAAAAPLHTHLHGRGVLDKGAAGGGGPRAASGQGAVQVGPSRLASPQLVAGTERMAGVRCAGTTSALCCHSLAARCPLPSHAASHGMAQAARSLSRVAPPDGDACARRQPRRENSVARYRTAASPACYSRCQHTAGPLPKRAGTSLPARRVMALHNAGGC